VEGMKKVSDIKT